MGLRVRRDFLPICYKAAGFVRLVNVEESIATPRTFVQVDRLPINTPLAPKQPIPNAQAT